MFIACGRKTRSINISKAKLLVYLNNHTRMELRSQKAMGTYSEDEKERFLAECQQGTKITEEQAETFLEPRIRCCGFFRDISHQNVDHMPAYRSLSGITGARVIRTNFQGLGVNITRWWQLNCKPHEDGVPITDTFFMSAEKLLDNIATFACEKTPSVAAVAASS